MSSSWVFTVLKLKGRNEMKQQARNSVDRIIDRAKLRNNITVVVGILMFALDTVANITSHYTIEFLKQRCPERGEAAQR